MGIRTNKDYRESALEKFVRLHYPAEMQHRWVSYQGTRKTIGGAVVLRGHGRPNGLGVVYPKILEAYVEKGPKEEVKAFYDLLVSEDSQAVRDRVDLLQTESANLFFETAAEPEARVVP